MDNEFHRPVVIDSGDRAAAVRSIVSLVPLTGEARP
jgi:hypothetical protein